MKKSVVKSMRKVRVAINVKMPQYQWSVKNQLRLTLPLTPFQINDFEISHFNVVKNNLEIAIHMSENK